jgi:hypothetical protein
MSTTSTHPSRFFQVFVSPETDPVLAAADLGLHRAVQLIPVSIPASLIADHLARTLRSKGAVVSITRPLAEGTDISSAATIARV